MVWNAYILSFTIFKEISITFSWSLRWTFSQNEPQLRGPYIIFFSKNFANVNIRPYGENAKIPFLKL